MEPLKVNKINPAPWQPCFLTNPDLNNIGRGSPTILVEAHQRNISYNEIGPVVSEKMIFSFGCHGNQNIAWIPNLSTIYSHYHQRINPVKFG